MAVVGVINLTLIDVCMTMEMILITLYSCNYVSCKYSYMSRTLTCAVQSSFIQLVPCVTAADEAPNGVSTTMFTATICGIAFIDVFRTE